MRRISRYGNIPSASAKYTYLSFFGATAFRYFVLILSFACIYTYNAVQLAQTHTQCMLPQLFPSSIPIYLLLSQIHHLLSQQNIYPYI